MMSRLIIDYPADIDTIDASDYVREVIRMGKISVSAGVPCFCWVTRLAGLCEDERIIVRTRRKKKGQTSDSFLVYREEKAKNHG